MQGGFFRYVKEAFLVRWNLLIFGAAVAAGVISGEPSVVLPLALAAEIIYTASLSTNRKFQAYVDAVDHKVKTRDEATQAAQRAETILQSLPDRDRGTFEQLRKQCTSLSDIASRFRGTPGAREDAPSDRVYGEGINRLLWIYLRLLYSRNAIETFFSTVSVQSIEADLERAKQRLSTLSTDDTASPTDQRRRSSLEDQIRTSQLRLENYGRAKDNNEFIKDELARLSAKIAGLAEMAVAKQDPDAITAEVDSVSRSVESSEKAMSELDFLTGWPTEEEAPPDLLSQMAKAESLDNR